MTNQRVPPHRKATCHKGMPPLCRMLTGTMSVLRRNSTMNPRMLAAFREASSFLGWAPLITADFSTLRVGPGISGSLRKLPAAREFRYKASYLQCELAKHKGLWLCIACGYRIVGVCVLLRMSWNHSKVGLVKSLYMGWNGALVNGRKYIDTTGVIIPNS